MASRPPTEQQVVLDADGRPVMNAMDAIVQRIGTIQTKIKQIQKDSFKTADDFKKTLDATIKDLRNAMGELRTLQQPGVGIQMLNNNRGLARATVQATDYARSIGMARTSVEALQAKINDLNREIAGRGANNQGATVAQRDRLALYEKQLAAVRALETAQERLDRRAARTKGGDLSAERRALEEARARLEAATLDPKRVNFTREIRNAQLAQDQFTESLNRSRGAAMALAREQQAIARAARAAAPFQVRNEVANGANARTIMVGAQFDALRQAERLAAATGQERTAALQALELAKARAREAERLVNAAEREAAALQRRNTKEEQAAARLRGMSRRELAVGEVAALRDINAVENARIQNALRLNDLRMRLKFAAAEEARMILQEIQLEKAVGAELNKNLSVRKAETREIERQAKANRPVEPPKGPSGPSGFMGGAFGLPQGGLPTIFARTAAYGAAGMGIFAIISTIRQGLGFAVEFEDALRRLQAISGSTDGVLGELSQTIETIGRGSRFSLVELTEMATKLAQAGVSAAQMAEALQSVATLATASGSTPQEAVDLVTAALGAFQLAASETPRIADMITSALNRTRLTVQQAALAIQYVGATAFEQNISLEQLLATAAALSQAGIRSGSTIGTGMRQFLVDLQSPTEKLTDQLSRLKISMADVDVTTRGLPAVLQTLNDAGFGAAQAYGSLETRAAAFYLTARNNTDLMAELQMQFAEQGAAMIANERAMDSVAAQWQRFKNILGEGFMESMDGILNTFKNVLRQISDRLIEARRIAESGDMPGLGVSGSSTLGQAASYDLRPGLENLLEFALNGFSKPGSGSNNVMLGTWLKQLGQDTADLNGRMAGLNTTMQKQTEQVSTYEDRVRSLDHEIGRLVTQQDSLEKTHGAVSAETVTLASRFEGLSRHLLGTTNDVNGLILAMRNLRNEEAGLLAEEIQGQVATANQQILAGRQNRTSAARAFRNSPAFSRLNPQERAALDLLEKGGGTAAERRAAAQLLSDRNNIWTREGRTSFVNALTPVITTNSGVAQAEGTALRGRRRLGDLAFQQTPIGQDIARYFDNAEAAIAKIRTAERGASQNKLATDAKSDLTRLETRLRSNIAMNGPNKSYQEQALREAMSFRQSIDAILAPTKEETREADKAAKAAEREAKKPRTAAEAMADFERELGALGIVRGSGRTGLRSAADQNEIFRNGESPLDGYRRVSRHQTHQGLDPSKATHNEAKAREAARRAGLTGFRIVRESGGRFHYEWKGHDSNQSAGATSELDLDQQEAEARRAQVATERRALRILEADLRSKLKDLRYATSEEMFNVGEDAANKSFDAWSQQIRAMAASEIANGDFTDEEVDERLAQAEEQIAQRAEEISQSIFDAILKNIDRQLKVAERRFADAIRDSEAAVSYQQSVATGFGYESMKNRVPDYVQQLQQRRIGMAQEEAARTRLAALPGRIADTQNVLTGLINDRSGITDPAKLETLDNKIKELTGTIADLRAERDALEASFSAGGLVPTNVSDGLRQAIQAYQEAQGMTRTFKEELIYNLGGAVQTVHEGLTTMFTDIMTGSRTVLQAFGDFVRSMIKYMIQLAAKALATRVFNIIAGAISAGAGGGGSGAATGDASMVPANFGYFTGGTNINGVPIGADGLARLRRGGGRVMNGNPMRDSVNAKIAMDEWVVQGPAVRSVGHEFMANLNAHGAKALDAMRATPVIEMPHQEVNVWVTAPQIPRQMTKRDVVVAMQEDMLQNGDTKRLIKHVVNN